MDKTTTFANDFEAQRQAAVERREALNWLSRRLAWENRLGQLRPAGSVAREVAKTKRAA